MSILPAHFILGEWPRGFKTLLHSEQIQMVPTSNLLNFVTLKSYPNRVGERFFHVACNRNWTSGLKTKKSKNQPNPLRFNIRK